VRVIVRGRQASKTYESVQWVLAGEPTDSYPGWSRVLLCMSIGEADHVRAQFSALDYRQVFGFEEWRRARLGKLSVEVMVDDADLILASTLGQSISGMTVTGTVQEWGTHDTD